MHEQWMSSENLQCWSQGHTMNEILSAGTLRVKGILGVSRLNKCAPTIVMSLV